MFRRETWDGAIGMKRRRASREGQAPLLRQEISALSRQQIDRQEPSLVAGFSVPPLEKAHPDKRWAECKHREESQPQHNSADPEGEAPDPQQVPRPPGKYACLCSCSSEQEQAYRQE